MGTSLRIGRAGNGAAFFVFRGDFMRRVFVFIDGFNLYHALEELEDESLKWLNLWRLSQSICRPNEILESVQYFTAYATWLPEAFKRHRDYVRALEIEGVTVKLGSFKKRRKKCKACGDVSRRYEEKETDVNVAIHLVAETLQNNFDRGVVITADSDFAPAVTLARTLNPDVQIDVVAPPNRFGRARELQPLFEITKGRVRAARLDDAYHDDDGKLILECPKKYLL